MFLSLLKRKDSLSATERAQLHETARLLKKMCAQHVFIDVRIPGRDELWRSMLLGVDVGHREVHMDELFPVGEASELRVGERITITCRDDQTSLRISTRVRQVLREGDALSYLLDLPVQAEKNQRRDCWRMPVEGRGDIGFTARFAGHRPCAVDALDISQEGVRLSVPMDVSDLEAGRSVLHDCNLELGDLGRVRCNLVVRNVAGGDGERTVIGGSFANLSGFDRRQIASFLAASQRTMLRRMAA